MWPKKREQNRFCSKRIDLYLVNALTFQYPLKTTNNYGEFMFLGVIEIEYWLQMVYIKVCKDQNKQLRNSTFCLPFCILISQLFVNL